MDFEWGLRCVYHFPLRLYIFNLVVAQMTWKSHYLQNLLNIFIHRIFHKLLEGVSWVLQKWPSQRQVTQTTFPTGEVPTDWNFLNQWTNANSQSGSLESKHFMESCSMPSPWKTIKWGLWELSRREKYQVRMPTLLLSRPIHNQWRDKWKNDTHQVYRTLLTQVYSISLTLSIPAPAKKVSWSIVSYILSQ